MCGGEWRGFADAPAGWKSDGFRAKEGKKGSERSDRVGQRGGRGRGGTRWGGEARIRKQEVPLSCELQGESEI